MTVKTKISVFITGAGFISGLIFTSIVFFEMLEQPFDLLDSVLREEAFEIATLVIHHRDSTGSEPVGVDNRLDRKYWIDVRDHESGELVYRSHMAQKIDLPLVKRGSESVQRVDAPEGFEKYIPDGDGKLSFRVRRMLIKMNDHSFLVQIARPIEKMDEEIRHLAIGIASGFLLSMLVLIVISRYMALKILQPVEKMNRQMQEVCESRLDMRVASQPGNDEFNEHARIINRMLDRLQESFARQKNYLYDTSHELKTPLATMRLVSDEIYSSPDMESHPSLMESLERLRGQVLRMERLVKNLLKLASLEVLPVLEKKPVELRSLVLSLVDDYRFAADSRSISTEIDLNEDIIVLGDEEKLRLAFSNILDNAVKYSRDGGCIGVSCEKSGTNVLIIVTNTGNGDLVTDTEKVFDQFYRGEKSRSSLYGGTGLGLAIVKRIISVHGGQVAFEMEPDGFTRLKVFLPVE